MRVIVLGVTGYTGKELISLMLNHPDITEILPVSKSQVGVPISTIHKDIPYNHPKFAPTRYQTISLEEAHTYTSSTVFSCLPHRSSHTTCHEFLDHARIIDLSADYRLTPKTYEAVYSTSPPLINADLRVAYGLCELYREEIRTADVVAVPGCFAGTVLSVLLPLQRNSLLPKSVSCVAMTGISGAGKQANNTFSFCERNENITAYTPLHTHRHVFEIEEKLDNAVSVSFTPVLTPVQRGIYAILSMNVGNPEELIQALSEYYADAPFVVVDPKHIPSLSDVLYTNTYRIGTCSENNTLQCFACSDNLRKGASGQALQCFNIMYSLQEQRGL